MIRPRSTPIALTIAGSDSGGGAGIQADLKTFAAFGVHGTSAITSITAQNPRGVLAIEAVSPRLLELQIAAIFSELPPAACKTGMLYSAKLIEVVARFFHRRGAPPLIVDPVMVATSGALLLQRPAIRTLREKLLPVSMLVTPNTDEAAILCGFPVDQPEDLRAAARFIVNHFGCAALLKGGHLRGGDLAIDVFYDGREELLLSTPFVRGVSTHGTGCTYSAAIVAAMALGEPLPRAVIRAKEHVANAIAHSLRVGRHQALNSFWRHRQ